MRVTNKMLSYNFLKDMRNNLNNMRTLQQQLTSGKEIRRPSDNPFKVSRAMQLHTDIGANKQYNENIKDTINWLDTTDTALGQAGNVIQRVRELLLASGNAGYGTSERKAIKDEINQKIGEFSQILNTNFDGKYIFGGTRATSKPVDVVGGTKFDKAASTDAITMSDLLDNTTPSGLKNDINISIGSISIVLKKDSTMEVKESATGANLAAGEKFAPIKDLNDLSNVINKAMGYSPALENNLRVVPNFSDSKLMFVNTNESNPSTLYTISMGKVPSNNDIMNAQTSTYDSTATQNARLMYRKKDGGELINGVEYDQISTKMQIEISQGVFMEYNTTANEILEFTNEKGESKDIRAIFEDIVKHLDSADPNDNSQLTGTDLDNISDSLKNLLKLRAVAGAKQNRMEAAKDRNVEENFNMTDILANTEDIDITEKTMEFATMQTVYVASLQTSAKIIQPSLMDYLR